MLADVKFGELITPTDIEIVFGHLEHHRERLLMPEDADSHYEEEMASAIGRPVPPPLTTRNLSIATDDGDELDVHSSCTCGSFGLSSTRVLLPLLAGAPRTQLSCLILDLVYPFLHTSFVAHSHPIALLDIGSVACPLFADVSALQLCVSTVLAPLTARAYLATDGTDSMLSSPIFE